MPLPLHLPRRHCQPLLFPPGLLALAWLLWLGCAALPRMRRMEKQQVVMQLAVPSRALWRNETVPLPLKDALVFSETSMSPLELAAFRPWMNVSFTGNLWSDYFSYQQVSIAALDLKKHSYRDSGVRVFFAAPANYRSFIYTLDKFNTTNPLAKPVHYWLDIRHQSTAIYAITSKPAKPMEYYAGHQIVSINIAPLNLSNCLPLDLPNTASPPSWQKVFQPDWRNSTLLLLLLAALSAVRLYRQHRTS